MNDTNAERFRRVATARTAKAVAMLRLLGSCSDLRHYCFTQEEANELLHQIETAFAEVKEQFANPTPHKGPRFALKERNNTQ